MGVDDDDTPPYPRRMTPSPEAGPGTAHLRSLEGLRQDGVTVNKRLSELESRRESDREHVTKLSIDLEIAYGRITDLEREVERIGEQLEEVRRRKG